jgi:hypothetical protein
VIVVAAVVTALPVTITKKLGAMVQAAVTYIARCFVVAARPAAALSPLCQATGSMLRREGLSQMQQWKDNDAVPVVPAVAVAAAAAVAVDVVMITTMALLLRGWLSHLRSRFRRCCLRVRLLCHHLYRHQYLRCYRHRRRCLHRQARRY